MMHKSKKAMLNFTLISVLVISMFILPLTLMIPQASAADPVTVLTSKWSRSGLGTSYEGGMVIGDIDGDGHEEVVVAGYSLGNSEQQAYYCFRWCNWRILNTRGIIRELEGIVNRNCMMLMVMVFSTYWCLCFIGQVWLL